MTKRTANRASVMDKLGRSGGVSILLAVLLLVPAFVMLLMDVLRGREGKSAIGPLLFFLGLSVLGWGAYKRLKYINETGPEPKGLWPILPSPLAAFEVALAVAWLAAGVLWLVKWLSR